MTYLNSSYRFNDKNKFDNKTSQKKVYYFQTPSRKKVYYFQTPSRSSNFVSTDPADARSTFAKRYSLRLSNFEKVKQLCKTVRQKNNSRNQE